MDLEALTKEIEGCEIGHKHDFDHDALEDQHGNLDTLQEIFDLFAVTVSRNFPSRSLKIMQQLNQLFTYSISIRSVSGVLRSSFSA